MLVQSGALKTFSSFCTCCEHSASSKMQSGMFVFHHFLRSHMLSFFFKKIMRLLVLILLILEAHATHVKGYPALILLNAAGQVIVLSLPTLKVLNCSSLLRHSIDFDDP